jgi:hypothetical protein
VGSLRAPIHKALLVAENWFEVLVLVHIVNLKTSPKEVGFNLFQVLTLAQPYFDSTDASAYVLDRITFDNCLNYMLCLSNLSKVGGLGILRKTCNHQIEHMAMRLLSILAIRILLERAILAQNVACKILNLKSF